MIIPSEWLMCSQCLKPQVASQLSPSILSINSKCTNFSRSLEEWKTASDGTTVIPPTDVGSQAVLNNDYPYSGHEHITTL